MICALPLGAIAMSAQFLVRSEALRDAETRAAGRIVSSAGIMAKMVSDLLDFAQVRMGGHLSISPARMSLSELCADAVTELRAFHPERSIELDIKDRIDGHWDRDRVRQTISNLVENAVGHGAAEAPVKVSAVRSGAHVQLAVHNFGEPIPPVHQLNIFNPLTRLSKDGAKSRRPNGIGLGLFIVMETAEAHGGSVAVVSEREAGTTFTMTLPVAWLPQKEPGHEKIKRVTTIRLASFAGCCSCVRITASRRRALSFSRRCTREGGPY